MSKEHRKYLTDYLNDHEIVFKKNAKTATLQRLVDEHMASVTDDSVEVMEEAADMELQELDAQVEEAEESEDPLVNPVGKRIYVRTCSKTGEKIYKDI